ncbi:phage tail protein [Spirulina major]|uniref:phage tail protein n=1 Tax=Spirulina major TaxID=270636 RepID=UPI0009330C36|nr:tail fiber protein [Spirulina major]
MEGTIGEIRLFAGNFAPRGWAFCDGQTLNVSGNEALYSILENKYGGKLYTTFTLPKIAPVLGADTSSSYDDLKYIICLQGYYPSRP